MLKTISAALLAVSVLAAPALAAGQATKQVTSHATKTAQAPVIKAEQVKQTKLTKPNALNANARMGRHHVRHASHHRFHKHYGALKSHKFSKVSTKHVTPAIKRG
ncbi:MAG: His-rich protein BRANT [Bradyrhizobium sp.]